MPGASPFVLQSNWKWLPAARNMLSSFELPEDLARLGVPLGSEKESRRSACGFEGFNTTLTGIVRPASKTLAVGSLGRLQSRGSRQATRELLCGSSTRRYWDMPGAQSSTPGSLPA